MTYTAFNLKLRDLKLGMHVVLTLFYSMKTADCTYLTYFLIFKHLKRVGKISSRSDLDSFLYSPDLDRA